MSEETETMESGPAGEKKPPEMAADVADNAPADAGNDAAGAAAEDYEPAELDGLGGESGALLQNGDANLDVILDIPVTLSMEIGRTRVSIQELLQLAKGSVVELDRMAGEPLDVLVNGTLVARGEVVVVNDKFGVRLSDVISTADRVQTLG